MSRPAVTQHIARNGARIYTLPVEVFPQFSANVYVLLADPHAIIIDAGSGLGNSNDDLLAGFAALADWGESVTPADLTRIVLTHAHTDHFGGLTLLRQHTDAPIAMHMLDRRVITNYEGRLALASKAVSLFLRRAGVSAEQHTHLMQMYTWGKGMFRSLPVQTCVEEGAVIDDLLHVIHTPGHCPGQMCLRMDEILFTADHVLSRTSPHMAPETITPSTGLDHYYAALHKINALQGVELALGGHEAPMTDLHGRVAALFASHQRKLDRVLDLIREQPRTIADLSVAMYRNLDGYDVLLALEEVGAHVEYLYLRGFIAVQNINDDPTAMEPLCYEVVDE